MRHFPVVESISPDDVVSVNGVGDTFLGVLIAALARSPDTLIEDVINVAQCGSTMTLRSKEAVSPEISSLKGLIGK